MKELVKDAVGKFAFPVLAAACIGLGGLFVGNMEAIGRLDSRLEHVEVQIERHEKALERDFQKHEQTVATIATRTDDQERRLTRLETLMDEVHATLSEIRSDVKILLRGGQQ